MPNTLAHIGIQGLVTRGLLRNADLKWIYLGCILPDLPWILQRAMWVVLPEVSAYDLRLYVIIQSSLFMCVALAIALSCVSSRQGQVLAVLVLGSLLHLLMDALQIKWASGVHLLAPFSWSLLNYGLFWPEDLPSHLLTGLGLVFFVYAWRYMPSDRADLVWPRGRRLALCAAALVVYVLGPLAFMSGPFSADNHSIQALRQVSERPGREVEFDRVWYEHPAGVLHTFAGERLALQGPKPERSGKVSVRGSFLDETTVVISDLHLHPGVGRNLASYLGLGFILLYWLRALVRRPRA